MMSSGKDVPETRSRVSQAMDQQNVSLGTGTCTGRSSHVLVDLSSIRSDVSGRSLASSLEISQQHGYLQFDSPVARTISL